MTSSDTKVGRLPYMVTLYKITFRTFKRTFLKLHSGSFKETIFEIIQIPKYGTLIEFRLGITTGKIKSVSRSEEHTSELQSRE